MKLFTAAFCISLLATPVAAATITVNAGGDLQAALTKAAPGDVIVVQAGATFTGQFRFPAKPFGQVITVRSSATLPDRRLTPADAPLLPLLQSNVAEAVVFLEKTANWRLEGIQFGANVDGSGNIVQIQDAENITLDRILIVAPATGQKRGVMGNGKAITLTRSHIAGIWRSGQDSQAFCAWDGAGPYVVRDNYLEAASENVMFGGANSQSAANIPSDILVEGNLMTKPLAWKGVPRTVKNLFELKSAKRAVIRNNVFENNWTDAQSGMGILFTGRNDEGQSPWSVVEDVLFEHNVVRNTEGGINVLGYDSYQRGNQTTRVTIRGNLLIVGKGNALMVGSEIGTLTYENNTIVNDGTLMVLYKGAVWPTAENIAAPRSAAFAIADLTYRNNLAYHREYGFIGEDAGIGLPAVSPPLILKLTWGPNVVAGGQLSYAYPAGTLRPTEAAYAAELAPDFTLLPTSAYRTAGTGGSTLGWDGVVAVPPTQAEICGNKIDDDRDGAIDEDCPPPVVVDPPTDPPADTQPPKITSVTVTRKGNSSNFGVVVLAEDARDVARINVLVDGVFAWGVTQPTALGGNRYEGIARIGTAGLHVVGVVAFDAAGNSATTNMPVKR